MAAYSKHTWTAADPITKEKLNAIETGISNAEGTFIKKVVLTLAFSWNSASNDYRYVYTDSSYVANMRPIFEVYTEHDYQYILADIYWDADASDHTITFSTKFDPASIKGSSIYLVGMYFLNLSGTGNTTETGVIPAATRLHTGQNLIQQNVTPKYNSLLTDSHNASTKGTITYSNDYDALYVANSSTNTRFYLLQSWPTLNGEFNNTTPFTFSVDVLASSVNNNTWNPRFSVVFTDTSNVQSAREFGVNNKFRHKDHATGGDYIWTTYYGSCIAGEDVKSVDICFITGTSGSSNSDKYYIKNFKVEYGFEPTGFQIPIAQILTKAEASDIYLTQSSASSTYLTQTSAASTYLTPATAASTYLAQNATLGSDTYSNPSSDNTDGVINAYRYGRVVNLFINGHFAYTQGQFNGVTLGTVYRPILDAKFLVQVTTGSGTSPGTLTIKDTGAVVIKALDGTTNLNAPDISTMRPNTFTYIGKLSTS